MKKIVLCIALMTSLVLTACGTSKTTESDAVDSPTIGLRATTQAARPADLTGEWTQSNRASEDSYQQATITADSITIEWVSNGGDTTSIYWVGTFAAPTNASESYMWTSQRDAAATDKAMLASTADTKDFSYTDESISYKLSALGTTTTVRLKKK